jgi:hypothetical protein
MLTHAPAPRRSGRSSSAETGGTVITARDISLAYVQAVSAYWRGDSEFLPKFDAWLAQYWTAGPPEPSTEPQAHCPHGAAGRGIHWHEQGPVLLGYVPGKRGCFRIPRTTALPREAIARKTGTASHLLAA